MSDFKKNMLDQVYATLIQHVDEIPDSNGLKSDLAAIFSTEPTSTPAESKHITILLSDIRGFTAITETYSARTVVDMLNRYYTCMSRIVIRYGGTIDKFMGDSIMVLFGAPTTHPDDAERAIACAVEMQQAMSEFNQHNAQLNLPEIFIGIGINSGSAMAGTLGSDIHREYTVIGDEVNLVSRIEAQSLRGQILLSKNTYNLAKDYIEVGPPNDVTVKGKRQSVALYELLATAKPRTLQVPRREIRKSPRVPVHIPIYFRLLEDKTVLPTEHKGEVIDLSYNGLQAFISKPIPINTEVRISLSLHLLSSESTEIYARIITLDKEVDTYRAGMEFTFITPQGKTAIKEYVDNMIF